jgi:hypothetical protein
MAIEATLSKYKKNNLKIYIGVCIIFAAVLAYDGYLSKYEWSLRYKFYEKHVKNGKLDDAMIFNRVFPLFLLAFASAFAFRLSSSKDKKVIVDDSGIVINGKVNIPYDSVQKLDKTYFDSKGFFTVTYLDTNGNQVNRKLSVRDYDNLSAVLDKLVAEIS